MGRRRPRTSWVFDRPLLRDGLFWAGLALGVVLAVYATSPPTFTRLSLVAQIVELVWRMLVGVLVIGVIGGSVRNFVRGYRGARDPAADARRP